MLIFSQKTEGHFFNFLQKQWDLRGACRRNSSGIDKKFIFRRKVQFFSQFLDLILNDRLFHDFLNDFFSIENLCMGYQEMIFSDFFSNLARAKIF